MRLNVSSANGTSVDGIQSTGSSASTSIVGDYIEINAFSTDDTQSNSTALQINTDSYLNLESNSSIVLNNSEFNNSGWAYGAGIKLSSGSHADSSAKDKIFVNGIVGISATSPNPAPGGGVDPNKNSTVTLISQNQNTINGQKIGIEANGIGTPDIGTHINLFSQANVINVSADKIFKSWSTGVQATNNAEITIALNEDKNASQLTQIVVESANENAMALRGITAESGGTVTSYSDSFILQVIDSVQRKDAISGNAAYTNTGIRGYNHGHTIITSNSVNIDVDNGRGAWLEYSSVFTVDAKDNLDITTHLTNEKLVESGSAIYAYASSMASLTAGGQITLGSQGTYGIWTTWGSNVDLNSNLNVINVDEYDAIQVEKFYNGSKATTSLTGNRGNIVFAGAQEFAVDDWPELFGTKIAIKSGESSAVTLQAGEANYLYGAVYVNDGALTNIAEQDGASVTIGGIDGVVVDNVVHSNAVIDNAGNLQNDLDPDSNFKGSDVISALYAEGSASSISISGRNIIRTYADSSDTTQLERTVWVYDGASIELDGWTLISTDRYDTSPQSLDVAIAAGTAVNLTDEIVSTADAPSSSVTVSYENDGAQLSHIEGDVLAAYDGSVKVQPKDASSDGLSVKGNLLAGNKGELSLNLGKGGELIGRADSYMDADGTGNDDHTTFFDPAFSSTIYRGGTIDLNMGEGSTWTVTGQSWVTNLSGHGTINLVNALEGVKEDTSHALHVQNLSGKHTFVVNLNDSDHSVSDMLYINNVADGSSEQVISIDSFEGLGSMAHLDRIRFATVNASNSDLYFVTEELNPDEPQTPEALARASRTQVRDVGFYDVGFRIESETRLTDTTVSEVDDTYDGKEFNTDKPGKSYVDTVYGSNEEDAQNWYLVRDKSGDSTSDGGETILATARAVYWNAVEIDRLNKRLGDARHANGGTDGFWVRVRNDRIGTDAGVGDFRSRNYAYQFGYDHTKKENDGKRLFGAALDYMDGNTTYRDIEGSGATDRFGVTAYMTWLGDDGWYYDLVGKWGVLSNSFRITSDYGVFVDGDYDNHVLGASFEFGRKLTKENSPWFLEPQAQIQHVMVTEASYSTNQGTHVDQDKINSTITRLGFRIGRNFGEKQSGVVYAKADWLKEWHGHQGIKVTDTTTGNTAADVSIDNKGNWFDVGFGVQSPITDTTYFFADAEYVFGNDLDNTWNFNAGVRWMFH